MHGYRIAQVIGAASEEVLRVEEGSLYPALQRMLMKGWVTSEWAQSEAQEAGAILQANTRGPEATGDGGERVPARHGGDRTHPATGRGVRYERAVAQNCRAVSRPGDAPGDRRRTELSSCDEGSRDGRCGSGSARGGQYSGVAGAGSRCLGLAMDRRSAPGCPLRSARLAPESGIRRRYDCDAGAGHRRNLPGVQRRQRHHPAAISVPRSTTPHDHLGERPEDGPIRPALRGLFLLAREQSGLRGHGRGYAPRSSISARFRIRSECSASGSARTTSLSTESERRSDATISPEDEQHGASCFAHQRSLVALAIRRQSEQSSAPRSRRR